MSDEWKQWEDLPREKEEELIEKLAQLLVKNRIGLLGKILLESGGTLTSLFAEFYMGIYGPYFDFLEMDEYVALLRRKENIPRLLARIEEKEAELTQ
jgi:delta 1-pyrroline-5-carboxylate dehydrogenase